MPDSPNPSTHPDADEPPVHPGWSMTPQDEYELGVSGGWGTPGNHLTGPIPKLRPSGQRPSGKAPAADPDTITNAVSDADGPATDPVADVMPADPVILADPADEPPETDG